MPTLDTQDKYINQCSIIHNNKYDYTRVVYTRSYDKIEIICPIHGVFSQIAADHKHGRGCNKCAREQAANKIKLTQQEFIQRATKRYNNKYDYSKVVYVNTCTKVEIICPIHGSFFQSPSNHLYGNKVGCLLCGRESTYNAVKSDTDAFIDKSNIVHEFKYDYSESQYINNTTPVKIGCNTHGTFLQKNVMKMISNYRGIIYA